MTSEAHTLATTIASTATKLARSISPHLPPLVQARLLLALSAMHADLQRHLTTVNDAVASLPHADAAGGIGDN